MDKKNIYTSKRSWVFHIIKNDLKLLILSILLGVLVSVLGLVVAFYSQKFIDEVVPQHDLNKMCIFLCMSGGLLFFKIAASISQQYMGILYNKRFNLNLINQFFKRLLKLPKSFFDVHDTGAVIARMNDSHSIQETITFIVNTFVLNSLVLVSSSLLLFHYSKEIGIITWLSLPAFFLIAFFSKKKLRVKVERVMNANEAKESNFISTIKNIDLIKSHNKETYFAEANRMTYGNYQETIFRSSLLGTKISLASEITGTAIYIAMFSYASYQLILGTMSIGAFSATLGIATGMMGSLGALGFSALKLQGAIVAFNRMYEFESTEIEYNEKEDEEKKKPGHIYGLEFKNVYFSYNKETELLKEINFKVKKGEILCLWGENGSGKSTILKLIMLLYKPDYGEILFGGININELSIKNVRDKVALVAQQSRLFNLTIIENICYDTNPQVLKKSVQYLNSIGFDRVINKLPDGYQTVIYENGENLSGGQKQIISLARALNKKPDILILDEPSASLDVENENFVFEILNKFKRIGTIIMVTHKHAQAQKADQILVLKNGVIQYTGIHDELISGDNIYAKSFVDIKG